MSYSDWNKYNLDEIYEVTNGLSKKREEFGFGYPFLTFREVFYNYYLPDSLTELANSTERERERCSISRGDVFLTRTSETQHELGLSSVALKDYPEATFNGFTKRLRAKVNNIITPEFAGFYFRSPSFRNQVTSMSSMTTRASLNNSMLTSITLKVPPLEKQKRISEILFSLTEKVKTNIKINQTLEEMAQAIFKHWFVDFEFPNENGEPYKSSGGNFVESELGMIPEGWGVTRLGDMINISSGKRPKKRQEEKDKEFIYPLIGASSIMGYVNEALYNEDILIIGRVGTHGIVQRFSEECWPSDNTLVIKSDNYNFVYQILSSLDYSILNRGSTQPLITQTDIKNYKIILPVKNVLALYETIIQDSFNLINQNDKESANLVQVRDTLLPKLMSGEIRIPDAEQEVEACLQRSN